MDSRSKYFKFQATSLLAYLFFGVLNALLALPFFDVCALVIGLGKGSIELTEARILFIRSIQSDFLSAQPSFFLVSFVVAFIFSSFGVVPLYRFSSWPWASKVILGGVVGAVMGVLVFFATVFAYDLAKTIAANTMSWSKYFKDILSTIEACLFDGIVGWLFLLVPGTYGAVIGVIDVLIINAAWTPGFLKSVTVKKVDVV